jgi:hypothetical protein
LVVIFVREPAQDAGLLHDDARHACVSAPGWLEEEEEEEEERARRRRGRRVVGGEPHGTRVEGQG